MPIQFHINNPTNKILVWYLTEPEENLLSKIQLSESELIKLSRISNKLMRASFLAIRNMVHDLGLSEIKYQENGKPTVENGYISISHSGHWLGLHYSENKEVGLDLEKINSRILKIKDRFLSQNELRTVCGDQIEKMILCWSAKEAVFKKYGGETVFFKDKIEITSIDEVQKKIVARIHNGANLFVETLSYSHPDEEYVLVHTN